MNRIYLLGKIFFTGILIMTFNQSCTNLDEELYSEVRPDDFFQTEEEFIAALGSAYTNYGEFIGEPWSLSEVSSDEVVVPTRGGDWGDNGNWARIHTHQYQPGDDRVQGAWRELFKGVNTANRLIFQFESLVNEGKVDATQAGVFIGELEVLRSLFYFFLTDLYGNVPIVDRFDVPEDFAPAKNTRQEVFDFIITSVTDNLDVLTKDVGGAAYGRMNYWAAQALLAKMYLNAEVWTGKAEWQKALDACNEIINSGNFSLESNYFNNFAIQNEGSTENIYVIVYDQIFSTGMNVIMRTLHYQSQFTYNLKEQPWNGYCSVQEFYESYIDPAQNPGPQGEVIASDGSVSTGTIDGRRGNFVVGPQFDSKGNPLVDENAADPDGPEIVFTAVINELAPQAYRQAGARIGKYEFQKDGNGTGNANNDYPIFRYGDFLLMKAEIMWRMDPGSQDALDLVNMIRGRAGVDDFASLNAGNLLAERGREMAFEYYRRQDLIRFDKYNDAWRFHDADPSDHVNLMPIPREQLEANPNLTQNPGY